MSLHDVDSALRLSRAGECRLRVGLGTWDALAGVGKVPPQAYEPTFGLRPPAGPVLTGIPVDVDYDMDPREWRLVDVAGVTIDQGLW